MSFLLHVIGAIAVMVGVGMVAFGIPINEFSFGNTLIVAGFTTATGGLIIIALGVVAGQIHRLTETIAGRPVARAPRPLEGVEPQPEAQVSPAAAARTPMPSRPRPEPAIREAYEPRFSAPGAMGEEHSSQAFAPALRNPDAPPLAVEDEISLSPQHPAGTTPSSSDFARPARVPLPPGANGGAAEHGHPPFQPPWRGPPQPREIPPANFDAMWPPDQKPSRTPGGEVSARPERAPREPALTPQTPELPTAGQPRTVAILKSGVVDGMGYTLYVDGSIEAELPQGTLRFASIEDLRSHLEKNS
jgi:hypothetical protein